MKNNRGSFVAALLRMTTLWWLRRVIFRAVGHGAFAAPRKDENGCGDLLVTEPRICGASSSPKGSLAWTSSRTRNCCDASKHVRQTDGCIDVPRAGGRGGMMEVLIGCCGG